MGRAKSRRVVNGQKTVQSQAEVQVQYCPAAARQASFRGLLRPIPVQTPQRHDGIPMCPEAIRICPLRQSFSFRREFSVCCPVRARTWPISGKSNTSRKRHEHNERDAHYVRVIEWCQSRTEDMLKREHGAGCLPAGFGRDQSPAVRYRSGHEKKEY
jgi:hypothetical protein